MFYELETFLRSVRRDGLKSTIVKVRIYFQHFFSFLSYLFASRPHLKTPEEIVDFARSAHGGLIHPGQVRNEIIELAKLVSDMKPQCVVEIGTANGGTFFVWAQVSAPNAQLISIDLPGGIHGGGYPFWRTFLYRSFRRDHQSIRLLRGSSYARETIEMVKRLLDRQQVDFLFIDGDHTLQGVEKDFDLYSPLVRKGGIIALHDICYHPPELGCEVDVFWNRVKASHRTMEIIENPSQGWAGIGVIFVE